MSITFVQGAGNEQNDIVDHIGIAAATRRLSVLACGACKVDHSRYVVEELAQRLYRIGPQEVELVHEDLGGLVRNSGG